MVGDFDEYDIGGVDWREEDDVWWVVDIDEYDAGGLVWKANDGVC